MFHRAKSTRLSEEGSRIRTRADTAAAPAWQLPIACRQGTDGVVGGTKVDMRRDFDVGEDEGGSESLVRRVACSCIHLVGMDGEQPCLSLQR